MGRRGRAAYVGGSQGAPITSTLAELVRADARRTAQSTGRPFLDGSVLAAIEETPRAHFIPARFVSQADRNAPLPIGHGQTISQPFVVALMTDLLEPAPDHRVLEIGGGSGYQAAVLAHLVAEVHSVEIVPELAARAAEALAALGVDNVHIHEGNGRLGWPANAPYDGILVAAATPTLPPAWVEQLAVGGRLVVPVGESAGAQELVCFTKQADGSLEREDVLPVRFVPLTGDDG